ncbi:MAG: four helix bundle protein [Gemmatimonadota bacterium]
MRVYQLCRELAKEIDAILQILPPRLKKIADHLERSMESGGLNLSEGLVAFKPKVKASAFDISRREIGEVRKALQRAVDKKGIPAARIRRADEMADCYIGMMTVMIKQQEERHRNGE